MTYKNAKTILFASLIAAMIFPISTMDVSAASTTCPTAGHNGETRCYAVKDYRPSSRPASINVDVTADDVAVTNGFQQNALWVYLSNGRFIESGFVDTPRNNEKIVCGTNGGISNSQVRNFSDGDKFNAYSLGLSNGKVWKIGVKHMSTNSEQSCTFKTLASTYATKFLIGSEATIPNSPNYTHDWNDLEINYSDVTFSDFSSTNLEKRGPNYDVEECGTGSEPYRHIKTGKGSIPSC